MEIIVKAIGNKNQIIIRITQTFVLLSNKNFRNFGKSWKNSLKKMQIILVSWKQNKNIEWLKTYAHYCLMFFCCCDWAWGPEDREDREELRTWHCDCCDSWSDTSVSVMTEKHYYPCCHVYAQTLNLSGLRLLFSLQNLIQQRWIIAFFKRFLSRFWTTPKQCVGWMQTRAAAR